MSKIDEVIELLYKAKGVDNCEIESIAYEIIELENICDIEINSLNVNKSIKILEYYQLWKLGEIEDMKYSFTELEKALNDVIVFCKSKIITPDKKCTTSDPTLKIIEDGIIREYGYNFEDLKTPSKSPYYFIPRYISIYLIDKHTPLSRHQTAYIFKKDVSNVSLAKKSIEKLILENDKYAKFISEIEKKIDEEIQK